jgi:hypothetical protein
MLGLWRIVDIWKFHNPCWILALIPPESSTLTAPNFPCSDYKVFVQNSEYKSLYVQIPNTESARIFLFGNHSIISFVSRSATILCVDQFMDGLWMYVCNQNQHLFTCSDYLQNLCSDSEHKILYVRIPNTESSDVDSIMFGIQTMFRIRTSISKCGEVKKGHTIIGPPLTKVVMACKEIMSFGPNFLGTQI